MAANLFAYSETGVWPYFREVQLELSDDELAKVVDLPDGSTGVWADVTDEDGVEWSVRREHCGFPTCVCAARAVRR